MRKESFNRIIQGLEEAIAFTQGENNGCVVHEFRTPEEWLKTDEFKNYTIMDHDGWRGKHAPSWDTPLSRKEFNDRLMECTVRYK